ncbi:MAG: hypothetical protein AAFQ79_04860 [Pseudomonadota bacterium]
MQLIESSIVGLRSARHTLRSPDHPSEITLFPMIHVGTPEFYNRVFSEAREANVVITEGVRSPVVRRIVRSYRWIGVERLGLILQPPFDATGEACEVRSGDLDGSEFDALWRQAPLTYRAALEVGAPIFGLWRRFTATRATLAGFASTDSLPDRQSILSWNPETAAILKAVHNARDRRLCDVIEAAIGPANGPGRRVAVIFGAGHMGVVARHFHHFAGFRPIQSEWIEVFPV